MRFNVLVLCALGLASVAMAQQADMIRLIFSSEGETAFAATCQITNFGQVEERVIEEKTPFELTIPADGLSCRTEAEGSISVEMIGPHRTRSKTRSSGGSITIMHFSSRAQS